MNTRIVFLTLAISMAITTGGWIYSAGQADLPVMAQDVKSEERAIEKVLTYVQTEREDDPLQELDDGLWIKTSNIEGLEINGQTYYYSLFPHMSYDPLTRGEVKKDDINIVYQDDDPAMAVIIYTIR